MTLFLFLYSYFRTKSSNFFGSFVVRVDRLGSLVAGFVWISLVTGSVFVTDVCVHTH